MIVRCPNTNCNTKMSVKKELLSNPDVNVKCPSCKQKFKPFEKLPQSQRDEILNQHKAAKSSQSQSNEDTVLTDNNKGNKALGWLVVHDEKASTQTYDLYEGIQLVGKKSLSRPCDIMVETSDSFMSRNHFTIEVLQKRGHLQYILKDANSTNRTYVETKMLSGFVKELRPLKEGEEVYVEDGDIIQAGRTKIILKTSKTVRNRESATQIVSNQQITKTVII